MKIIAWPFFPDLHYLRFHQYHSNRVLNCNNSLLIRTVPCSTIAEQIMSRNSPSSTSTRQVFTTMPALRTRPLVPSIRPRSLMPSLCRQAIPAPRRAALLSCPRAPPVPRRHPRTKGHAVAGSGSPQPVAAATMKMMPALRHLASRPRAPPMPRRHPRIWDMRQQGLPAGISAATKIG